MNKENGFTILEALFSMAIFAVAMFGVIGLQLNAIQTDEETRRKDMASQLLAAGTEMVECLDYDSLGAVNGVGYANLLTKAKANNAAYFWMGSSNNKAGLFCGQTETVGDVNYRNVYLVAVWNSIKTGQRETLSRMMVKPPNMLQ
ncbi:prepilin-type N-terminal cleavage/methylation domain-containing protein [Desulfoluna sp.]|uniref:type IV pilus modification PilV family protein n=1 Tax=Desulfoluna sp. TaxID=2045199 RepID=UPI00261F51E1|nr:prepilin-type N-terminal cleavage/methylation domain-containing protein [Desulfoluna sp.]